MRLYLTHLEVFSLCCFSCLIIFAAFSEKDHDSNFISRVAIKTLEILWIVACKSLLYSIVYLHSAQYLCILHDSRRY